MKKMSRPVVTPSAPKAWHPKTSTKKVFWGENWGGTIKGTGSRAAPRAPRINSAPQRLSLGPCRRAEIPGAVDVFGDPVPNVPPIKMKCCPSIDPASGRFVVTCATSDGKIKVQVPDSWNNLGFPTYPLLRRACLAGRGTDPRPASSPEVRG